MEEVLYKIDLALNYGEDNDVQVKDFDEADEDEMGAAASAAADAAADGVPASEGAEDEEKS